MAEPKCAFCDKVGLLLMPARYAIAPLAMGLPSISAPMKVEDIAQSVGKGKKQDVTLHGSAQYTARLLRSGYLYVYDEKRDRMDAYWIRADGYYMSIPVEAAVSAQAKSATPCSYEGHRELAGCIAIADAENAGIVWLGFSDVQWTKAVIDAHKGAKGKSLRQLHMREFDAGAWAKSHRTPAGNATAGRGNTLHTVPMSELASTVAEYAPGKPAQGAAFAPLSAPNYRLHVGKAEGVLSSCSRRSPKLVGAIVALDDPAGVAQDLAALINWHQERLLDTRVAKDAYGKGYGSYATTYRNLLTLDGAIKALHASNDEKVKMQVFMKAEALANMMKAGNEELRQERLAGERAESMGQRPTDMQKMAMELFPQEVTARQLKADAINRNPPPVRIAADQHDSWNEYLTRIKPTPYKKWADEFKAASDQLQNDHIEVLARTHAAWMQSNLLANTLDCTHDGKDALSGDVYAETLQRCMVATQQIPGCADVYLRWLKGDITEKTNLLLRALVLRQDELITAMAAAPLDSASVPWSTLMDQFTKHVQMLLKPAPDAQLKAQGAQKAAAKAKTDYDDLFSLVATSDAMGAGSVLLFNNSVRRKLEAAESRMKAAQISAREAKQETNGKLLPDSVAALLTQIATPIATALREFNGNAAEQALARWMAIVGVTLRTPAGVIKISGGVRETIDFLSKTFVANLGEAAKRSGRPLSADQVTQLTTYARRQVAGSFASGNIASFETAAFSKTRVNSKLAVFITDDMHKELANITDPTKKVAWLVANVTTPATAHEYAVLRIQTKLPVFAAVSEGILTAIDVACKYAGWNQMLVDEAKALSFQKTWAQDVRVTLGGALYVGAMGTGVGNVVKAYGTWRNLYATGMAERVAGEQLAGRAGIALRVAGALTAAVSGVMAGMDFVDVIVSKQREQWSLMTLQLWSGAVGITNAGVAFWAALAVDGGSTMVAGLSLTGWGLLLAVVLVALAMAIDHLKGDAFAQWLERCYWGELSSGRYIDSETERLDFNKLMGVK
jgi:hypothetical protein